MVESNKRENQQIPACRLKGSLQVVSNGYKEKKWVVDNRKWGKDCLRYCKRQVESPKDL
jgi:uncharacterized protein YcsI (UPF0317 family)